MGVIDRWRDRLPVTAATPNLTLGEGATPLIEAPTLSEQLGVHVFLKLEGANPTGSFKDRGMVVAVACALERGATALVCASTGNTAASAAAYAARAKLPALILHPAGAVSGAKAAQSRAVGADVVPIEGTFDDALRLALEAVERGYVLVNSVNPDRIAGQRTAAYEIVEQLGSAPDVLALPYGGGGNTVAYAEGFAVEQVSPRLVSGEARERSSTVASAIRIGEPVHAGEVADTSAEVVTVSDEQILEAWTDLARLEGVLCEPASAAGLAALRLSPPPAGATVVCVLTGHGLKDVDAVDLVLPPPVVRPASLDAISRGAGVVTLPVAAPASTANLGSGIDCAARALGLWNELEVEPGRGTVEIDGEGAGELPVDRTNMVLRAFALAADPSAYAFKLLNRIPLERGLGSSAAAIAAGYAAGCAVSGRAVEPGTLPADVVALEGHADNLAAAFFGGVCLTWTDEEGRHVRRVAEAAPLEAIAVIPATRSLTSAARAQLPASLAHAEATRAATQSALLAAALVASDAELFVHSTADLLHEPYRAAGFPLFTRLKADPPRGVRAVTLSGSGPTSIAWVSPDDVGSVVRELAARFPEASVTPLPAAAAGVVVREAVTP